MVPTRRSCLFAFVVCLLMTTLASGAHASDGTPDPNFGFGGDGHFGAWFDYLPGGSAGETATAAVVHEGGLITVVGHFQKPGTDDLDCGIVRTLPNAGGYDPTFMPPNGYGPLSFNLGGNNDDVCHAMLKLAFNEVLIAGGSGILAAGERAGTLIKLHADGSLDPTFYGDGMFDTSSDLGLNEPGAAITFEHISASTGSPRVVVAGNILRDGGLYSRAFVLGLNGFAIDPAFNGGLPLELGDETLPSLVLTAVKEDAQLRVHVLAYALDPLDVAGVPHRGLLFRLMPDGRLDPTFSDDGRVALPQCSGTGALAFDVDGILVGCSPPLGGHLSGVLRLHADGSVDSSFGVAGHAEMRMESWDANSGLGAGIGVPVALQTFADGTMVGVSTYTVRRDLVPAQGRTDLAVARLRANGAPDTGFGSFDRDGNRHGSAHYRFGLLIDRDARSETGVAMTLDEDGSLIVVGSRSRDTAVPGTAEFVTARLLNRGENVFANGFE